MLIFCQQTFIFSYYGVIHKYLSLFMCSFVSLVIAVFMGGSAQTDKHTHFLASNANRR